MFNANKYFVLLENLQFSKVTKPEQNDDQRLAHNLRTLQQFIRLDNKDIVSKLQTELQFPIQYITVDTDAETYVISMLYVLQQLTTNINLNSDAKEDLIAMSHINLCIVAIQDTAKYALSRQLHKVFYKSQIYRNYANVDGNFALLYLCIEKFGNFLTIVQLHLSKATEVLLRDYMTAIYSLKLAHNECSISLCVEQLTRLDVHLKYIWTNLKKSDYFRNIMLMQATPGLPVFLQKALHSDLFEKLTTEHGFATLVTIMHGFSTQLGTEQMNEVIGNIVANPKHTLHFQRLQITNIMNYCSTGVNVTDNLDALSSAVYALRRLYDLHKFNQDLIKKLLAQLVAPFITVENPLCGAIIMEHTTFCKRIALLHQLFCTSVIACLPSILLVRYLPMLLQLYGSIPETLLPRQHVCDLVIRCLDNRNDQELTAIVGHLYTRNYAANWQSLHERLILATSDESQTFLTLKITPDNYKSEFSITDTLPKMLMFSIYHNLTYRIFVTLIRLMIQEIFGHLIQSSTSIDLLSTDMEFSNFLNAKYSIKVDSLLSLNMFILHQPLKAQLKENSKDFLRFLREMLELSLKINNEDNSQIVLLLLMLLQELLEQSNFPENESHLLPLLSQLQSQSTNKLIQQRVRVLEAKLNGELKTNAVLKETAFNKARNLIESEHTHLQVYGIDLIMKHLQQKDPEFISQGPIIVALALSTLHNKESYTFLNCVRLFVALVRFMEVEVIELLEGEYLNDLADIDYRLVVGEAIVRIAQELGPLCYKYKTVLLNCFMHGARSSLDEFRMSAYANLAQLCRILTYQVHNHFQELLMVIDAELSTGKYLPAKRAATLVLSEILQGVDNLIDFEEMLLPIYSVLRHIEANESCDAQMRLHAANGLKALNEKCLKILLPVENLQKEIHVLDVKSENKNRQHKPHILELN